MLRFGKRFGIGLGCGLLIRQAWKYTSAPYPLPPGSRKTRGASEAGSVVVIGAGISGLSTAYFLAREGVDVTVVERAAEAATLSSFKTGSIIRPTNLTSFNRPRNATRLVTGMWDKKGLVTVDAKVFFQLTYLRWLLGFASNSTEEMWQQNTKDSIDLAMYTQAVWKDFNTWHPENPSVKPENTTKGCLQLFASPLEVQRFRGSFAEDYRKRVYRVKRKEIRSKSAMAEQSGGIISKDPLAWKNGLFTSADHITSDKVGDTRDFCLFLEQQCKDNGVKFQYGKSVDRLKYSYTAQQKKKISSAHFTEGGDIHADNFVLCAGVATAPLARTAMCQAPILPLKGYVLTANVKDGMPPLEHIVEMSAYDFGGQKDLGATIVPVDGGRSVKIIGNFDATFLNTGIDDKRVEFLLKNALITLIPGYLDLTKVEIHQSLYPMSTDGKPLIGKFGETTNLYINSGHGNLGWTQGLGSGSYLSDVICGRDGAFLDSMFTPDRFSKWTGAAALREGPGSLGGSSKNSSFPSGGMPLTRQVAGMWSSLSSTIHKEVYGGGKERP